MYEFLDFITGRARSAGITRRPVLTVKILQEGKRDADGATSVIFVKHNGVRHLSGIYHSFKCVTHRDITLYLRKTHFKNF